MSGLVSTDFQFTSADGLRVACSRWDGRPPIRGIVQIAHGMGEHVARYAGLIEVLVSAGLTVYGNDHRGHGHTATSEAQRGDFGGGGFDSLVEDMVRMTRIARSENPNRPLILLGHSMGSFAAQQYVLDHSAEVAGLALSGSGALDMLANVVRTAPAGTNVLNARFEPARTPFDWLSRDEAVVDAFMRDPLCFGQLRPGSFASFMSAASRLCDPARLRAVRRELPIYVFSGSDDPVGEQLEGVRVLIDRYRHAGIERISSDFYPGGRHEMLNEINRDDVRARLLGWMSTVLNG